MTGHFGTSPCGHPDRPVPSPCGVLRAAGWQRRDTQGLEGAGLRNPDALGWTGASYWRGGGVEGEKTAEESTARTRVASHAKGVAGIGSEHAERGRRGAAVRALGREATESAASEHGHGQGGWVRVLAGAPEGTGEEI